MARLALACGLLWPGANPLPAQQPSSSREVRLEGSGVPELDVKLRELLDAREYVLVVSDTFIGEDDVVPGDLLVLAGRVLLEGRVRGTLALVDANVFLRPSARIEGDALNLGGGLYRSALARIEGELLDHPTAPYTARAVSGRWVIQAATREGGFAFGALEGVILPTYDRVDGLTVDVGASYGFPALGLVRPSLGARVSYHTARGDFGGGVGAELRRGPWRLTAGAERVTRTNERWIKGDLLNSLAFALKGTDIRDYYEADVLRVSLEREIARAGWALRPWVAAEREDVRALRARDPWTLFSPDSIRSNLQVDQGVVESALAGMEAGWRSPRTELELSLELEGGRARRSPEGAFLRYSVEGGLVTEALFGHALDVEWVLRGPLAGLDVLPPRRWTFLGGSSTLRTFEDAQFRGDRLVYVETDYLIPLPRHWRLPLLGAPDLILQHAIGMAWSEGVQRDLEQNVGAQLQFLVVFVRAATNPATGFDDFEIGVGVASPF